MAALFPKKRSSISSRCVVELRRCYHNQEKKWFSKGKKTLIFLFADLGNPRKIFIKSRIATGNKTADFLQIHIAIAPDRQQPFPFTENSLWSHYRYVQKHFGDCSILNTKKDICTNRCPTEATDRRLAD